MSKPIVLTPADKVILASYSRMVEDLSRYLGPAYELVLHSLEDFDHSAIKVMNGYFTSRTEGAPLTNIAFKMLSEIEGQENPRGIVYTNNSKSGNPIRSTTIPISGENGRTIALLCINFHTSVSLSTYLNSLFPMEGHTVSVEENFSSHPEDTILSTFEKCRTNVMNDSSISTSQKNKAIILMLNNEGIFNLKDSVQKVADLLGVSTNTVYLHLRNNK